LAGLGWLIAAGFAVWTLIRIGGFDSSYPLFPLIAFTPYATLVAVLATGAALLLGLRPQAVVTGACALLLLIAVVPRALPDGTPDPAPTGPELRVLTANLLVGNADIDDVVTTAADLDADVISLAELTPGSADALAGSALGEALPHRAFFAAPGANGVGLMSRYPLERLPAPGKRGFDLPTIIAAARLPGGVTTELYSIHPVPPTGSAQVTNIERYLAAVPAADLDGTPRILAGDFNSTLDNAVMRDLLGAGYVDAADAAGSGLAPTWPQDLSRPPVTIDHVLADERSEVLEYGTHDLAGSDHDMVSVTLRLPGA